nr:MAG TPA: hypothetical protein [Caudoviricetes sp.]
MKEVLRKLDLNNQTSMLFYLYTRPDIEYDLYTWLSLVSTPREFLKESP